MANRVCKPCRELLRQHFGRLREFHPAPTYQQASLVAATRIGKRQLHQSASRSESKPDKGYTLPKGVGSVSELASNVVPSVATKAFGSYVIYGATEKIYKACSKPTTYTISEQLRKEDKVPTTEDGEEVGVGGGIWHDQFGLPPTFSTWSQVTMLHMWLLVIRLRCFDNKEWQSWQKGLVDHFFNDAEAKMGDIHGLTSRMIRSRYLSTLFESWRGAIMSYDEGLVKGDAVLAAAVWRNVFKSKADVDVRHLAAIVAWIRQVAWTLDRTSDSKFMYGNAETYLMAPELEPQPARVSSSPKRK